MKNWNPEDYPELDPKELEGLTPKERVKKQLENIGMCYAKDDNPQGKLIFDDSTIELILQLEN